MTLRLELTLQTAAPTTVVAEFSPQENRFVVKRFREIDSRIVASLRKSAAKGGYAPDKTILEANARTRGGTEELPWALLNTYSSLSKRTRSIVDRAFAPILSNISLQPDGWGVEYNELASGRRVRLYLINEVYFWLDDITKVAVFVDPPPRS